MIKILEKIDIYFTKIESRIIFISSLVLMIVSIIAVFNRYFLGYSMSWYEEISIYLFMILVYWGSSNAVGDETHYSVDIIIDKFKGKNRSYFKIFIWSVCLLVSLLGIYFGIKISLITTMKTVSLKIPNSIILLTTMVIAFTGMSLRYFYKIIKKIKNWEEDHREEGNKN